MVDVSSKDDQDEVVALHHGPDHLKLLDIMGLQQPGGSRIYHRANWGPNSQLGALGLQGLRNNLRQEGQTMAIVGHHVPVVDNLMVTLCPPPY